MPVVNANKPNQVNKGQPDLHPNDPPSGALRGAQKVGEGAGQGGSKERGVEARGDEGRGGDLDKKGAEVTRSERQPGSPSNDPPNGSLRGVPGGGEVGDQGGRVVDRWRGSKGGEILDMRGWEIGGPGPVLVKPAVPPIEGDTGDGGVNHADNSSVKAVLEGSVEVMRATVPTRTDPQVYSSRSPGDLFNTCHNYQVRPEPHTRHENVQFVSTDIRYRAKVIIGFIDNTLFLSYF